MKITYHEWKCVGCPNVIRFTGKNVLVSIPYWFTLRTEGYRSSSERPSFNTSVCSIDCLEKAGIIIRDYIQSRPHEIPRKKHIDATICNQCGKIVKVDRLNIVCGPSPLEDWIREKSSVGRKDFCSVECQKNHSMHPENSVFVDVMLDD